MLNKNSLDVYGIGNSLIDLLASVSDSFLEERGLVKDRMYLVDEERQKELLQALGSTESEITKMPGGSCANTMIGIAQLGGSGAFSGRVATDDHGQIYQQKLEELGIQPNLGKGNGTTGSCLVLVSDNSRTMNTHLGISQQFQYEDVNESVLQQAKYVYIEGYLWDTEQQKVAIRSVVDFAQQQNVKVALSLSDVFCVQAHLNEFINLLHEKVNLLFCNQQEAFALLNTEMTHEALEKLGQMVDTVAMTLGAKGALILHQGEVFYIDPFAVNVVDTTGAGDAFAAGFLYGLTCDKSIFESGLIASALAAEIIQQMGPRFQGDAKVRLQERLQREI